MHIQQLKSLFFNNTLLKVTSLLVSYSLWYSATYDQPVTITTTVPLCFTTKQVNYTVDAPETIQVTLQGKRSDLYSLDKKTLAAHININKHLPGKHGIMLNEHNLFLPHTIKLSHYKPSNLAIIITDKTVKET